MKILITGQSGTGKSTVLEELKQRGYTTYNTDDLPNITRLEVKESGEPVQWPDNYVDWDYYAWNWQPDALKKLINSDSTVFIAAVVSNQADYYELFDTVIVLTVTDDELYRRRTERTTHKYNNAQNIKESVQKNAENTKNFVDAGGIPVSNDRPVMEVVNEIVEILGL